MFSYPIQNYNYRVKRKRKKINTEQLNYIIKRTSKYFKSDE